MAFYTSMTLTSEVGLTIRSEHTPEIGYKDNKYPTAGADPKTDLTQINSYSFDSNYSAKVKT